jgi:hypothetical protein
LAYWPYHGGEKVRRILLLVIAITLVGALALVGTVDAKKKHKAPPFKTGPYPGSSTSHPPGKPSTTDLLTVHIVKSQGKFHLNVPFLISANCSGQAVNKQLRFVGLAVDKKKGTFSGKSILQFPGGTLTGKAKGKNVTATWKYKHANCTSSGTLVANHA